MLTILFFSILLKILDFPCICGSNIKHKICRKFSVIASFSYVFHKKYHKSLRRNMKKKYSKSDHAAPLQLPALTRVILLTMSTLYFRLCWKFGISLIFVVKYQTQNLLETFSYCIFFVCFSQKVSQKSSLIWKNLLQIRFREVFARQNLWIFDSFAKKT